MKLEMYQGPDLIATLELGPDDSFVIAAEAHPTVTVTGPGGRTVLSWHTVAAGSRLDG